MSATTSTSKAISSTEYIQWHGSLGDPAWAFPKCIASTQLKARPKYTDIDASEYLDSDDVLDAKVALLLTMMHNSKNFMVYTGAGISTAAGIADYASDATSSTVYVEERGFRVLSKLGPTYAHRVLAALEKKTILKHWLQQNHDGLAQKAGYPFIKLNEIHGAWFDKTNPVVAMNGNLRPDLLAWVEEWRERADLVLAMGSSLSGMNADQVASRASEKFTEGTSQGVVIVNLQRTQLDSMAQLRIFAPIDIVMKKVASHYRLRIGKKVYDPHPTPKDMEEVKSRTKRLRVK